MSSNPFLPLMPSGYPGDDWNMPPRLPQPDIASELLPATAPSNTILADEKVGADVTPYAFAASPLPEVTYNPYPVDLNIKQIVDEKRA